MTGDGDGGFIAGADGNALYQGLVLDNLGRWRIRFFKFKIGSTGTGPFAVVTLIPLLFTMFCWLPNIRRKNIGSGSRQEDGMADVSVLEMHGGEVVGVTGLRCLSNYHLSLG